MKILLGGLKILHYFTCFQLGANNLSSISIQFVGYKGNSVSLLNFNFFFIPNYFLKKIQKLITYFFVLILRLETVHRLDFMSKEINTILFLNNSVLC